MITKDFECLLNKPVAMMTGEDLVALFGTRESNNENKKPIQYAYGLRNLADVLFCSLSKVVSLKKDGVLDGAIISSIGRKIIFDVEKARILAQNYTDEQAFSKDI